MPQNKLLALAPDIRALCERHIVECSNAAFKILVYMTYRGPEIQAAFYAQGRRPLVEVNRLRAAAKLPTISESENRSIVTDAPPGRSLHEVTIDGRPAARAYDAVPIVAGVARWGDKDLIARMGEIGESIGLEWGGRWRLSNGSPDSFHFQLREVV